MTEGKEWRWPLGLDDDHGQRDMLFINCISMITEVKYSGLCCTSDDLRAFTCECESMITTQVLTNHLFNQKNPRKTGPEPHIWHTWLGQAPFTLMMMVVLVSWTVVNFSIAYESSPTFAGPSNSKATAIHWFNSCKGPESLDGHVIYRRNIDI